MIVRKTLACFVFIGILCGGAQAEGERWSRQISNSEWIPLASPRNGKNVSPAGAAPAAPKPVEPVADSSAQPAGKVPAVALPPALQQQYQDQLVQLQKTQESIQRLLLLQQQLKAQQQLLQSHAYQPNGFNDEKQALHQSTIVNLQTLPELAPEVLVPPVPSSEALPPVFRAQNFHPTREELKRDHHRQTHEETVVRGSTNLNRVTKPKTRFEGTQRFKEEPSHLNFVTPMPSADSDEEEEIQLVYVPAETLAQRGQSKLQRIPSVNGLPIKNHQHHEEVTAGPLRSHDAFAREILHQLQKQHEEKNRYLSGERQKEIERLRAEQKEVERQERIQQEIVRKEQEILKQKEAEKKRKELEKIEETARQQEFQRLKNLREKERQDQRRTTDLKAKEEEERRKDVERVAAHSHIQSQTYTPQQPHALPLVRDHQLHHQHLTEVTNKNNQERPPKSKLHHYQQSEYPQQQYQQTYQQVPVQPTTPSPNQPPLSVYMSEPVPSIRHVRLIDVLKSLKNAKSIAVLDTFGPETPRVFVGPRNLDPPAGFAKFDLPYLSSIENNRVERKVDKLPFFVAPLSFEPPPGYSKIPFPAPHIGSVVVNNLENVEHKSIDQSQNIHHGPFVGQNPYFNQPLPAFPSSTPIPYSPSTPRYDVTSLPPSQQQQTTKWRFRDFFENKPTTEIPSAVTAASYQENQTPVDKFERPFKQNNFYNQNEVSTTPSYFSPKTISAFSFEQAVPQSTPAYQKEPPSHHTVEPHLINHNLQYRGPLVTRFPEPTTRQPPVNHQHLIDPTGHTVPNTYYSNQSPNYDEQTQYNLPAELPAISPQLPGLVNALVEKPELSSSIHPLIGTTPTTTTTTTTTTEAPTTTTYRPRTRQRGRVTATRGTTLSPPTRGNSERTRRPVNRPRSRTSTTEATNEEYGDSSFDPTRRNVVTTPRYPDQNVNSARKTIVRNQSYRPRDEDTKEFQSQILDSAQQGQQRVTNYEPIDHTSPSSLRDAPASNSNPIYQRDDYSASTVAPVDSFSHRNGAISDSLLPLAGLEFTRKSPPAFQNYDPKEADEEDQPVNGFNYKLSGGVSSSTPRDFPYYRPKQTESSVLFEPIVTTISPNVQRSHLDDFSPVYHSTQGQFETKVETPRPIYREPQIAGAIDTERDPPVYQPTPQDKQQDYAFQTTLIDELPDTTPISSTTPSTTTTTTTTTAPSSSSEAPVIIRQRVRGRLGGRPSTQTESSIQTQPHGSQNDYVKFSVVNQQEGGRPAGRRARPRNRVSQQQQQHHQEQNSPIQTEGGYVRIQGSSPTRRPAVEKSTRAPVEEPQRGSEEEEPEYGFIRTTNSYRPSNHKTTESSESSSEQPSSTESNQSQAQIQKSNRQKLYASRRPSSSRATTPRSEEQTQRSRTRTTASYSTSEETKKTTRPKLRRPAGTRKRPASTTTTTEATDANNELSEENYPRPTQNDQDEQQYKEQRRGQEISDENYPQEFLLNYGSSQGFRQPGTVRSRPGGNRQTSNSPDIYGAESQWSTKLTGNSFQPSSYTPNQPEGSDKALDFVGQEKAGDLPEIITASPEMPESVTVMVSSDESMEQQPISTSSEESVVDSMINTMMDFGVKKAENEESDNASLSTPAQAETSSTETTSSTEVTKKPFKKLRRRKHRPRPKTLNTEDFTAAESQGYDTPANSLSGPTKFRNFYLTTESAATSAQPTTPSTTTTSESEKSMFETLLDKMLGENENVVPESTTSSTTSPDEYSWTSPQTIVPEINQNEPSTTLKPEISSPVSSPQTSENPTTAENSSEEEGNTELPVSTTTILAEVSENYPSATTPTTTTTAQKSSSEEIKSSGENIIQSLNRENSVRYLGTKSPAYNEYLRNQQKASENNPNYPKNHRSKWSEVRYPNDKSVFDYAKWNAKNQQSGEVKSASSEEKLNEPKNDGAVTDIIKAVFESIKSADEEQSPTTPVTTTTTTTTTTEQPATTAQATKVKTSVSSSSRVSSSQEIKSPSPSYGPFVPSIMSDKQTEVPKKTPLEMNLRKILRTSTSTKVSQMTEICYRGRCVMSKPKKEGSR